MKKINVGLVGLTFGGAFFPIYRDHPMVESIGIFDTNKDLLDMYRSDHPYAKAYESFEEMLADSTLDAIHIVTPIPIHADQSVAVLESGKHCACAVPMATSLEDIQRIVNAQRKSGKNYMMMETTLYSFEMLYTKELLNSGKIGRIQFLRGSHYQDMANWPGYWNGLPPMWYGTHAIAPMVALSGSRIKRTVCFGSGTMDSSLHKQYGNPYPMESALFEFDNGIKGEATRMLFETAREYQEAFYVYGSHSSVEWGATSGDTPVITTSLAAEDGIRGGGVKLERMKLRNFYQSLPEPIQRYTINYNNYDPSEHLESLENRLDLSPHGGSHPHLVNEFVMSIIEGRKPYIDESLAANITAAGICAHESAMKNGESIIIPEF